MRSTFAIFWMSTLLLGGITASAADIAPDALVQRGIDSYHAAKYQDAATDLTTATQAILSQDQMQKYVDTGKFENLGRLETALVYLALAESKLGHDPAARDAILRLTTAERIEPLYAQLPLQADAADFEALVKRVAPGSAIGPNVYLARGGAPAAASTQVAQTAPAKAPKSTPSSTTATPVASAANAPAAPASTPSAAVPTQIAQTTTPAPAAATPKSLATTSTETDRERYIEQRLAEERAKIQKAADERIAVAEKNARMQIEAAERRAQEQIAAAQRDAEQRIAAAQKGSSRIDYLATVREADSLAIKGKLDSARREYAIVANAPDAGRDVLAEAAVGLYRTGGFRDAVNAFRRVAPFAKGEEDLRFYNAVSLYESGNYTDAKKELACSLPYIERSDDVTRYQTRIELTGIE